MKILEVNNATNGDPANPCILLITGIGGQLVNWTSAFRQSLADKGFFVVYYDNRDAWLSKHDNEYGTPSLNNLLQGKLPARYYTLNDMADDAALLLDELKIEKCKFCRYFYEWHDCTTRSNKCSKKVDVSGAIVY